MKGVLHQKPRTPHVTFHNLYVQSDGHRCLSSIASSAARPAKEDFYYALGKERFVNCPLHQRRLFTISPAATRRSRSSSVPGISTRLSSPQLCCRHLVRRYLCRR